MDKMKTGERLLTTTVDYVAETEPTRACFSIPLGSSATEYVDISYKRFANSIDRLSWWLKENIGVSENFETICYLGPPDLLYFIFALSACKCGFKALFTSPRNSIEAHVNLLDKTECRILFGPKTATVSAILSRADVDHRTIEPLKYWLDEAPVDQFQHRKSFAELAEQPWLVLHTSGTTGLPKPVNVTHGLMSVVDNQQDLSPVDNKDVWVKRLTGKRMFCGLPPFHAAGTNLLVFAIFFGAILVLPPASQPPDLNLIETILDQGLAEVGCMAPSILEEIADSPVLEKLRSWEFVAFGGSPLSKAAGDKLWDVTKVFNLIGSTETYNLPELEPEAKDDWQYHAFHPSLGLKFEERSPDRFEAVFRKTDESKMFQGCFKTFKERDTYPMGDFYSKHPSKSGLWLYRGRVDNIVVLSNGEKFNPQDLEAIVGAHPDVRAVVTVGNGRTQPALLIEPEESLSDIQPVSEQIDRVWEAVVEANDALPNHAQIDRDHVAVLAPNDQFPRSSKGAVQRKFTMAQQKDLIEDLYNSAETKQCHPIDLDLESLDTLEHSLLKGIQEFSKKFNDIDPDSNLFESGMDSLQAVQLSRKLRSGLEPVPGVPDQFPKPTLIYKCPTVEGLARAVMSAASRGSTPPGSPQEEEDAVAEMKAAREQYAYEEKPFQRSIQPSSGKTVLLTGSTGRLGSYLLHSLLCDNKVHKIFCLGRSASDKTRERQLKSHKEKGLSCDFERVTFHQFDVGQQLLDLEQDLINEMAKSTTHIIHNAWPVNFNHSFASFKTQLQGCQTLLQLASRCSQLENLFFVSSVGAANKYHGQVEGEVPEESISEMLGAESMGYAQSKLVAELIFTDAAQTTGLPTTVCRVGQIAGAARGNLGSWNRDEWFPSLMITSKKIGLIPTSLGAMGDIDWLPSDVLADVLIQMTFSNAESSGPRVLHAVNPRRIHWSKLLSDLQSSSLLSNLKQVEFADWVTALQDLSREQSVALDEVPALKLLDFYEALMQAEARPVFQTEKGMNCSEELRNTSHIQSEWIEKWTRQWFEG